MIVHAVTGDGTYKIYERRGAPLVRFTGQVHSYTAPLDVPAGFVRLKAPLKLDASKISLPPPR